MTLPTARIVQLDVQEHEDNYRVLLDVILYAPVTDVWCVLTDYEHLKELTPALRGIPSTFHLESLLLT